MTAIFRHAAAAIAAVLIATATFAPVLAVPQTAAASVLGLAPVV